MQSQTPGFPVSIGERLRILSCDLIASAYPMLASCCLQRDLGNMRGRRNRGRRFKPVDFSASQADHISGPD